MRSKAILFIVMVVVLFFVGFTEASWTTLDAPGAVHTTVLVVCQD
ncbi:hypothetical protein ES708_24764 [subsurface metagenome]